MTPAKGSAKETTHYDWVSIITTNPAGGCRYTGMLLWSFSLAGDTQSSERACSVLYGIAVSTMWFRMLDFFLVQKDLGKVLKRNGLEHLRKAVMCLSHNR